MIRSQEHPLAVPVLLSAELIRTQHELKQSTCFLDEADLVWLTAKGSHRVQIAAQDREALAKRRVEAARQAVRRVTASVH